MTLGRTLVLILMLLPGSAYPAQTIDVDALKQRAASGDRKAARVLAEGYYAGADGLPEDFAQAAHYFQVLSNLGDVRAMTTLGLMYARGIGVPKSMEEAVSKWRFAAAQRTPDAGAEYNLGLAYQRGEGVAQDPAQALLWMQRAARRGHVLAQTNLGVMYLEGNGTERNEVEGAAWLIVAAQRGDAGAQENLKRFAKGISTETLDQAHRRAARWTKGPNAAR